MKGGFMLGIDESESVSLSQWKWVNQWVSDTDFIYIGKGCPASCIQLYGVVLISFSKLVIVWKHFLGHMAGMLGCEMP